MTVARSAAGSGRLTIRPCRAPSRPRVLRFSGESVRLTCAGRTDAGVHAIHQVAHVDLAKAWRTDTVRDALNAHLRPQPVAILSAEIVPETFDARHSAIRRHYRYRILNRRSPRR